MLQNPHVFYTFDQQNDIWTSKSAPNPSLVISLHFWTSKCASRHKGVHFFDISTSKSGLNVVCFVHFDLETCFAPQGRALFRHLNFQKRSERGVLCTFWLGNVLRTTTASTFSTSQLPKAVWTWCALYILTWKRAAHHRVHFFHISTSKSGLNVVCFVHFDLETCFVSQQRPLFRHLNFQKRSERGVLCTFWLGNVLRATTASTFSTSQRPKAVWTWCALYILTWKRASHHNSVHFFDISTSKSGPNLVCFDLCILTSKRASRHKGVHFFNISTSKSAPNLVCFLHFDLEMCFGPQRRATFHRPSSDHMALHPPL